MSVCLLHAGIVSKRLNVGSRKQRQGLYFLTPKVVGGQPHIPTEICAQSVPLPFRTPQFRPIFAHSASTVRAGEKVQLALIGSRSRAFQRAIDTLLPVLSPPKGGTKSDFAVLPVKSNFCRKKSATKCRPLPLKFALKVTQPAFRTPQFRPISAHSASTVKADERSSISINRKLTTRFPTSHR